MRWIYIKGILERSIFWKNAQNAAVLFWKNAFFDIYLHWKNVNAMLKRKITDYIEHFYKVNRGALLLTGARQIGKTYSIRKFAEEHFESFIEINFVESFGGKTFYKYLYDPKTVNPKPGNEMIGCSGSVGEIDKKITDKLPGYAMVIYTTEKP